MLPSSRFPGSPSGYSSQGKEHSSAIPRTESGMTDKVKECLQSCHVDSETKKSVTDLLVHLEGELQARELAVAALKSECLKHLLSSANVVPSSSSWLEPLSALHRDYGSTGALLAAPQEWPGVQLQSLLQVTTKQRASISKLAACLRNSEAQKCALESRLNTLLSSSQSKEESQKPVKRKGSSTQNEEATETTSSSSSNNPSAADVEASSKLTQDLDRVEQKLKSEQHEKMELVLLLLNDRKKLAALYLEEKRRSEAMARLLRDEQGQSRKMAVELEEESKRSLAMESEVEQYIRQLTVQREETKKIILEENVKNCELEEALRRSRQESDHLRKQLAEAHRVAMSQASSSMPPPPPVPQVTSSSSSSGMGSGGSSTYGRSAAASGYGSQGKPTQKNSMKMDDKSHAIDNPDYARNRSSLGRSGKLVSGSSASPSSSSSSSGQQLGTTSSGSSTADYFAANTMLGTTSSPSGSATSGGASSSSSSSSSKLDNMNTVRKMVIGGGKGLPPPVPPNKPAISVYKGSQMIGYNVSTKQAMQEANLNENQ